MTIGTIDNKNISTNEISTALASFISAQTTINNAILNKLLIIEQALVSTITAQHHDAHQIEQTLSLVAKRISRIGKRRIRCVFLISFLQSWNTLADVYDVMKASDDFEPIVVSTARKRSKDTKNIFGEEAVHEFLENEGVPHIRLDTGAKDNFSLDVLKALDPDLIFRQSGYIDLPPIFNPAEINFARLCYIPYSFTAVKRINKNEDEDVSSSKNHTDLYYHRLCWKIFCETEMHKSYYVNNSVRAGHNVVVTGYPKFDRLIAAKNRPAAWPITNSNQKKLRIIWAPHHSVSTEVMGFGMFVETHQEILNWAKENKENYEFVLKPHPALVGEIVHNIKAFSQEYMDAYFAEWNALPNTAIYEGGDYGPLFVGSDVMLTDGVGFLSEYQLFEKPVIFLDSGKHFGFNSIGEIMVKSTNKVRTISEAKLLCERFKNGEQDPMREIQKEVLPQIMPFPGQSAKRIVQAIREGLKEEGVMG